ncbi:MAG: epimerase [Acidobacteria bacterium]|nr:MAG: epimerase [Acidobacteriota bacterium]
MKIFLTGATGVIGIRVIPLLTASGHQVTAVVRSPDRAQQLLSPHVNPIQLDLFDRHSVEQALGEHDAVINLATHIPPTSRALFRSSWRENDRIRKFASANLVDAAISQGIRRFIQESFAPIYADRGDEWIDEKWPIEPVSYNSTVLDAEQAVKRFLSDGGHGVILRFALFYGPDKGGATLDLIKFVQKGWVPFPGKPENFISSVSHDDAATAVVAALNVPPGIYNVTDNEPVRGREYFNSLAETLRIRPPRFLPKWIIPLTGSLGKMFSRSLRISNWKLRENSEWTPRYPSVYEGWEVLVHQLK